MNNIPLPNNGMFAKDINSESGSQYSLLRHLYQKQGSQSSQIIEPTKKWMPNGNRDASSRINHRRAIQISRDMSSTQLPNSYNIKLFSATLICAFSTILVPTESLNTNAYSGYFAKLETGVGNPNGGYDEARIKLFEANTCLSPYYIKLWCTIRTNNSRQPVENQVLICGTSKFIGELGSQTTTITVSYNSIITLQAVGNDWLVLEIFSNTDPDPLLNLSYVSIKGPNNAVQLPKNNISDLQTIQQAKNKCRNQGYRVPPKVAASPHGHIISSWGKPSFPP